MAHAFQIDTLAFAKRLQAAGADERLAEAIVEGITDADTTSLATKEDLRQVKTALKEDIALVKDDLRQVEAALKEDIAQVKEDISKIHAEIANGQARILMWLFGMIAAMTALFMGAVPFLIRVAIASLPVTGN